MSLRACLWAFGIELFGKLRRGFYVAHDAVDVGVIYVERNVVQ